MLEKYSKGAQSKMLKDNKKGSFMGIMLVVGGLFLIVMFAIVLAIGSSTVNWVMDETVPELKNLGQVGDWNSTETIEYVIDPVDTLIQNFTWVAGLLYLFGIITVFGIAFVYRNTGDRWLIALFVAMTLILVIGCLIMSNIYEDIWDNGDELANIMNEHTLLSYMILYSPGIMSLIAFIAGIILFSGESRGFSV